jgi:penicillin-binding protein 1A
LPVEIWTRFMKAAHQGVAAVPLPAPASQPGGLLAKIAQAVAPSSAPPVYAPSVNSPSVNAPVAAGAAVRPTPTRASVRPEAASGLDGWLVDRLFGGR